MIRLPRPRLLRGIEMIAAEPSPEQIAAVAELVSRAERIRSGSVDPREDNMLAITNDGRKVALDMRVMDAAAADFPGSKVNLLVQNVFSIWEETREQHITQLVFCDLSKPLPPGRGFSVYNDVRDKLIGQGVPLFRPLTERGLHGVRLVISDACAGLKAAVSEFLPGAT